MKLIIGLILLILPLQVSSQSAFKAFFKLSCPEKVWVISHLFSARKAFNITTSVEPVILQVKSQKQLDNYIHGGELDAFRHAYWMAALTKSIGKKKALSLGRAHEKGNYRDFRKKRNEEGILPDSLSSVMDLHNNKQGAMLAEKTEYNELVRVIIDAVKSGKMKGLLRNNDGQLTDCSGNIPERNLSQWYVPYCLVSTDSLYFHEHGIHTP